MGAARGLNVLRAWSKVLLDFVYPPVCVSCGRLLQPSEDAVCGPCWNRIKRVADDLPLFIETRQRLLWDHAVSDLVSLFVFEKGGPFQHIVHAIKYQSMESLAAELGRRLGEVIARRGVDAECVVPVPLHRAKLRERGYNQAAVIARAVSGVLGLPVYTTAVKRLRYTQSQTTLGADERRRNVADAFGFEEASGADVVGKTCILVDDVITTGATTSACAGALRAAGAVRVIAASAALAQKGADTV